MLYTVKNGPESLPILLIQVFLMALSLVIVLFVSHLIIVEHNSVCVCHLMNPIFTVCSGRYQRRYVWNSP